MAKPKKYISSKLKVKRKFVLGGDTQQELYLNDNVTYQAVDAPTAMLQQQFDANEQLKAKQNTAIFGNQMARQMDYLQDLNADIEKRKKAEETARQQQAEADKQTVNQQVTQTAGKAGKQIAKDAKAGLFNTVTPVASNYYSPTWAPVTPAPVAPVGPAPVMINPAMQTATSTTGDLFAGAPTVGQNMATTTTTSSIGQNAAAIGKSIGGAALVAAPAIVGQIASNQLNKADDRQIKREGRSQYFDDTDYSRKEFNAQLLKSTGKGATMGGTIGSVVPGIGTGIGMAVGAGVGVIYGTGKALHERRKTTGKNWFGEKNVYDENLDPTVIEKRNREAQIKAMTDTATAMDNARMSSMLQTDLNTGFNLKTTTGQMAKYGGKIEYLKGGVAKSLGRGAKEYVGKKHEQGGIDLPGNIEVEGGETEQNNYIFSATLKLPTGLTYAQAHKNLLKSGASSEEIKQLALSQEAAAGRNPNEIKTMKFAKYGGPLKYNKGGSTEPPIKVKGRSKEYWENLPVDCAQNPNQSGCYKKPEDFATSWLDNTQRFYNGELANEAINSNLSYDDFLKRFNIKSSRAMSSKARGRDTIKAQEDEIKNNIESINKELNNPNISEEDKAYYKQNLEDKKIQLQNLDKGLLPIPSREEYEFYRGQRNNPDSEIYNPANGTTIPEGERMSAELPGMGTAVEFNTGQRNSPDMPSYVTDERLTPKEKEPTKFSEKTKDAAVPLPKISADVRRPMYPDPKLRMSGVLFMKDLEVFQDNATGEYVYRAPDKTEIARSSDQNTASLKAQKNLDKRRKSIGVAPPANNTITEDNKMYQGADLPEVSITGERPKVNTEVTNTTTQNNLPVNNTVTTTNQNLPTNTTQTNNNQPIVNTNPSGTVTYTTSDKAVTKPTVSPTDNKPRFFMGATRIVDENGNVKVLTDKPLTGHNSMAGSRLGTPTIEGLADVRYNSYDAAGNLKKDEDYKNKVGGASLSFSDAVNDRETIAGTDWGKRWGYKTGMSAGEAQAAHDAFASEMRTKFDQSPDEMLGYYQYLIDSGYTTDKDGKRTYGKDSFGDDARAIYENLKSKGHIDSEGKIKPTALSYLKEQATDEFVGPIHNAAGAYTLKGKPTTNKIVENTPPPGPVETPKRDYTMELPPPPKYTPTEFNNRIGLLQTIPAAYAIANPINVKPIAPSLAMGYVTPGAVGRANIGRVSYNTERAANQGNLSAMNQALQNMSGPGAVAGMLAAKTKADQQNLAIANAEQNANIGLAAKEAEMNTGISRFNVGNAMQAQTTNAGIAQQNAARMQQASQFNTQLKYAKDVENREQILGALDRGAQTIVQGDIDKRKLQSTERLAGIYDAYQAYNRYLGATQAQNNAAKKEEEKTTQVAKFGGAKKYISRLGDLKNVKYKV